MQQTTNYNLNKFDSTDELESATRLGLNENADTIDTALKGIQDDIDGLDASEVPYDNTDSGLTADNVQGAIDEICGVEPFSLTYSSAITDLNIQGESCYYNPATKEVYISFCIYSAGAKIPTNNALIAEIPEEYRPATIKTIGGMAFLCDNNNFTPYIEGITPISSVGKISLRNFIYGNKPTRVCSMNFNYVKD